MTQADVAVGGLRAVLAVNVHLPKDRVSMAHQGYGFCEFLTEEDAEYACKIMNQIKLFGKPIRVNKVRPSTVLFLYTELDHLQASSDKKQLDVGANLFVGNLDENVDERLLYDTFSAFGMMATTAKARLLNCRSEIDFSKHRPIRSPVTLARGNQKVTVSYRTLTSRHLTPRSRL